MLECPVDSFAGPDSMVHIAIVTVVSSVRPASVPLLPETQPDSFLVNKARQPKISEVPYQAGIEGKRPPSP